MFSVGVSGGFAPQLPQHRLLSPIATGSALGMAKKLKNKQAQMLEKMKAAKRQAGKDDESSTEVSADAAKGGRLSDEEIKERNDRLRFEELLKKQSSTALNDFSSDGYLSKEQEEEDISAARSGLDRLFEGDPAPTDPFAELAAMKSGNAIGETGKNRLVPWLRNTKKNDYLIIVTDPRMKSPELYETVSSLRGSLGKDIMSRLIIVNADTPAENRRWAKKANFDDDIRIYSDEKMDFMRAYTALGENRWSISMFIIQDERVARLARDIPTVSAARTISNAVKSLNELRL